jgi:putative hydrolase of the HAD superfamily
VRRPPREQPRSLLVDLDVIRRFDRAHESTVEQRHGLPRGSLAQAGSEWSRLRPALVGEVSADAWRRSVAAALIDATRGAVPAGAAAQAVAEWTAQRGEVVPEVLDLVRATRAHGLPVGLTANTVSSVDDDLAALGLAGEFDAVVSSTAVGVHKPTREFFAAACLALRTVPARCLYLDDEDRDVAGARVAGLSAHRWTGPSDLPYLRAALGLA